MNAPSRPLQLAAIAAVLFGVLSVVAGGSALYGASPAADAVPFVLRFNFMAGFVYILAGIGLWRRDRTAVWISLAILGVTSLVLLAFLLHVQQGGAHAPRTTYAMLLRIGVWAVIARIAWIHIRQAPRG